MQLVLEFDGYGMRRGPPDRNGDQAGLAHDRFSVGYHHRIDHVNDAVGCAYVGDDHVGAVDPDAI